jgi:hypothetical protein
MNSGSVFKESKKAKERLQTATQNFVNLIIFYCLSIDFPLNLKINKELEQIRRY